MKMKTIVKRTTATILFAVVMTIGMMAQPQNFSNKRCMNIPDLTEEQKTELQALRLEQVKNSQKHRNQMGEISAKQRTLMSESTIDEKAIGKLIDEKTALTNKHMKNAIAHKVAVNEVLTEEQQVYMNQMQNRRQQFAGRGAGRGAGKGFHTGQGRGAGKGFHASQGRGMRVGEENNRNFRGQNW